MNIIRAGLLLLFLSGVVVGRCSAAETEAVLLCTHTSDLLRGRPFNNQDEPQQDYCGAGVTITAGRRRAWEMDITHGFKSIDRSQRENGSQFTVRFYPGRLRRDDRARAR